MWNRISFPNYQCSWVSTCLMAIQGSSSVNCLLILCPPFIELYVCILLILRIICIFWMFLLFDRLSSFPCNFCNHLTSGYHSSFLENVIIWILSLFPALALSWLLSFEIPKDDLYFWSPPLSCLLHSHAPELAISIPSSILMTSIPLCRYLSFSALSPADCSNSATLMEPVSTSPLHVTHLLPYLA